jgi:hypothetical protein
MLERSRVSAEPDENFAADLKNKLASLHLDNISNTAAMNTNSNTEVAGDSASQSTKSRFNLKFALSFASLAILALVVGGIFFFSKNGSEDSIQVDDQYFAEVVFIEGDVQVGEKDGDSVQFSDISSGKSVAQGDVIRTFADSRAIIQLDDGSALRLNENTKLALDSLDPNSILVTNLEGEVFARVIKAERDFVVASDSLNLSSLGTAYKSVNKEKEEGVVVYESAVKFKKKESDDSKEVQEGKQLYIKSETKEIDTILDLTSEEVKVDDFALWNKKKDEENDEYKNKLGFFSNLDNEEKAKEETEEVLSENNSKPANNNTSSTPGSISVSAQQVSGGIKVSWSVSNLSASQGFKVVYSSSNGSPTFGVDSSLYVGDSGARSAKISVSDGKTYYIRICTYTGGGCNNYSNTVTAQAPDNTPTPVASISLNAIGSMVNWTPSGTVAAGVKVVWSKTSGPTYSPRAGDQAVYKSNTGGGSYTIDAFDGPGTYYVRVCQYMNTSTCGTYSNEVSVDL